MVISDDKTITETKKGLIWSTKTSNEAMNWESALKYCEDYSLAEYSDWRLPKIEALRSIVDYTKWNPAIEENLFDDALVLFYWSSTSNANNPGKACKVFFTTCIDSSQLTSSSYYVRPVRGEQSQFSGHLIIWTPMQAAILITGKNVP